MAVDNKNILPRHCCPIQNTGKSVKIDTRIKGTDNFRQISIYAFINQINSRPKFSSTSVIARRSRQTGRSTRPTLTSDLKVLSPPPFWLLLIVCLIAICYLRPLDATAFFAAVALPKIVCQLTRRICMFDKKKKRG